MPIQIDRMDTSIEITPATTTSTGAAERRPTPSTDAAAEAALAELFGRVMTSELERFLRNRGM